MNQEVDAAEVDFLLRSPGQTGVTSPVSFLSHQAWGGIKVSRKDPQKEVRFSSLRDFPLTSVRMMSAGLPLGY